MQQTSDPPDVSAGAPPRRRSPRRRWASVRGGGRALWAIWCRRSSSTRPKRLVVHLWEFCSIPEFVAAKATYSQGRRLGRARVGRRRHGERSSKHVDRFAADRGAHVAVPSARQRRGTQCVPSRSPRRRRTRRRAASRGSRLGQQQIGHLQALNEATSPVGRRHVRCPRLARSDEALSRTGSPSSRPPRPQRSTTVRPT